jgi:cell division protein FtsA
MAIYIEGDVYHTMVLAVGGNHITSDIAHGLRLPFSRAEDIKLNHGHCLTSEINLMETFPVKAFGEDEPVDVSRVELVHIIEARVEEIFSLILQEIKRSGYDGLLPAGLVLTGGSSLLPGMSKLAGEVMGLPAREARPRNLVGMIDKLRSPAFSTSVGLVRWAALMNEVDPVASRKAFIPSDNGSNWKNFREFLKRLLP